MMLTSVLPEPKLDDYSDEGSLAMAVATGFADLDDYYAGSLGRRYLRRVWEAVEPLLRPLGGVEVLDVGCGAGHYSELLAKAGAGVSGIDPDAGLVELARRRVPGGEFQVAGVNALPFADGRFERLLCSNVLEFVRDQGGAMRELRRVCRGEAVVCVLNRASLWGVQQQLFGPFTSHPYYQGRFFTPERLEQVAKLGGWRVVSLREAVRFPPLPVEPLLGWLDGWGPGACWIARLR
ncbi:class I SAM-dependent methyltransferase [Gloeobacter morelensis MG652769]|uniref:Class I SAM-dependent methyltransferase n=2 Tax=Gloeobacter TaxID=33071 RepID=A0ABY3PLX6_9CYAN|nr:class I SAM-dependent methyltransferase [Gloeobacter morelensis MG652769]